MLPPPYPTPQFIEIEPQLQGVTRVPATADPAKTCSAADPSSTICPAKVQPVSALCQHQPQIVLLHFNILNPSPSPHTQYLKTHSCRPCNTFCSQHLCNSLLYQLYQLHWLINYNLSHLCNYKINGHFCKHHRNCNHTIAWCDFNNTRRA